MLEKLCIQSQTFIDIAYQGLKNYGMPRALKCYFDPKNQKEKSISASQIVALFGVFIIPNRG
jgi:hypothetical protein